jgi:pimeloyl-ACP methyl ester carboxylesterase
MATRATETPAKAGWEDCYWWSNDGVRLHARRYDPPAGADAALPLLCLPGLTRNARDFDRLAPHLAQRRTVYAVEFRGRGESGYAKDALTYVPLTYVQDVLALLEAEGIGRFASVGTSLGGIVTMLIGAMHPDRLAAAVLNDIGPEIAAEGLDRIRGYVGAAASYPTWVHAARAVAMTNADVYPDWQLEDWLVMAKRTHRITREGRIVPDYDANIAQPFRVPGGESGGDLWPAFDALGAIPILSVRGALSDILAPATVKAMAKRHPGLATVTIARTGHAPTLDEPEAVAAIDALLAGL